MLFNSIDFLIFFPIVVCIYFLLPQRAKRVWLLAASYYFYMCWNAKYALLLLCSTGITYASGLLIGRLGQGGARAQGWKKAVVAASFLVNLALLGYFKYFDFLVKNIGSILNKIGFQFRFQSWDILLPVGISFFIFQALSYTVDVYRGDVEPEKNFLHYALFVAFFPQLVAGPIERSKDFLPQIPCSHSFLLSNLKQGLFRMGWGLFLKMVIADRIAIFVDRVYGDLYAFGGIYIVVATILFAFQIYCDFAGYSTIALGAAQILGYKLTDNFRSPYCAISVRDFWRRWHISLTRWFTDYLYIPLGGNRKGKIRKYVNQLIVFGVSGLWHGAMWSYVVWGLLNGIFLVIGDITLPARKRIKALLGWREEAVSNKVLQAVLTFGMVDFTWLFFRASGTTEAIIAIKQMISVKNIGVLFDGSLYGLGLNQRNFMLLFLALVLLFIVDIVHNMGYSIVNWIEGQNLWFRWGISIALILSVAVFGVWGVGYDKTAFIYFQF